MWRSRCATAPFYWVPERERCILPDIASIRESIVKSVKAGLLTCNFLPSFPPRQWTFEMAKILLLLTVARQLVILTQFPIILRCEAKPFPK